MKIGHQLAVSDGPEAVLPPKLQAVVTGFLVEPGSLLVCSSVAHMYLLEASFHEMFENRILFFTLLKID